VVSKGGDDVTGA